MCGRMCVRMGNMCVGVVRVAQVVANRTTVLDGNHSCHQRLCKGYACHRNESTLNLQLSDQVCVCKFSVRSSVSTRLCVGWADAPHSRETLRVHLARCKRKPKARHSQCGRQRRTTGVCVHKFVNSIGFAIVGLKVEHRF